MKSKFFCTYFLCLLSLSVFACSPKAEQVPEKAVIVSEPPVYVPPPKPESPYDEAYRTRLADKRYFGAAVPFGYEELACSEAGCRIATDMPLSDVLDFVEYYFPYQVIKVLRNNELIHITTDIREPFLDGGVLPVLDVHQVRPLAGLEVDVRIAWNRETSRYEWQYRNPSYTEPAPRPEPNSELFDDGLPLPELDDDGLSLPKMGDDGLSLPKMGDDGLSLPKMGDDGLPLVKSSKDESAEVVLDEVARPAKANAAK